MIQCDRETPQAWIHSGPIKWAVYNGVVLGNGATSRIGFWLWYLVPGAALLAGSPLRGAIVYGAYGLARGLWPGLITVVANARSGWDYSLALITMGPLARTATSAYTFVLGLVLTISIGLFPSGGS